MDFCSQDVEVKEEGTRHMLILLNCRKDMAGNVDFSAANAKSSAQLRVKGDKNNSETVCENICWYFSWKSPKVLLLFLFGSEWCLQSSTLHLHCYLINQIVVVVSLRKRSMSFILIGWLRKAKDVDVTEITYSLLNSVTQALSYQTKIKWVSWGAYSKTQN